MAPLIIYKNKGKSEHLKMIRELDVDRSELAKHVAISGHRIDADSMWWTRNALGRRES